MKRTTIIGTIATLALGYAAVGRNHLVLERDRTNEEPIVYACANPDIIGWFSAKETCMDGESYGFGRLKENGAPFMIYAPAPCTTGGAIIVGKTVPIDSPIGKRIANDLSVLEATLGAKEYGVTKQEIGPYTGDELRKLNLEPERWIRFERCTE